MSVRSVIIVSLAMRREEDGGRHGPFTEDYMPDFVVDGTSESLPVIATCCPGPVAPGDSAEVEFELRYHPKLDYSALIAGASFEVREGLRAVATGRVLDRRDHV